MDDALKLQLNYLQLSKVTSTDKVIGRGAYGRVIEVYVHGTLCAAKEIHPALVENVSAQEFEAIRRSFCEECVKASRIHHPNIVQMLGIYYPTPQAKLPWLVMELMQTSLKGFLDKYEQGKVPLHFKLSMLVDVAQGLEFLHGQDIIHRDLSSNNVLLTKNLIAKIADLGVAKVVQENKMKTHTQAPGTTHFMPPEALKSKPRYGKPVDVFSLACVALQVMSHQWPEPKDLLLEDSMTALTEMQRRDEYITFCTLPALKQLVELCLNNKPEQRPVISAVCVKLKELKVTIEKDIPFATDSNFELFDVVQQADIQNQKLNKKLTVNVAQLEEKDQQIREKDQQIQKRDDQFRKQMQEKINQLRERYNQLQEKDQQIQKRDDQLRNKDQEIQEKDQQIRKRNDQLREKDQQIQEKDNQLHDKDQQIRKRDDQVREKDQQIREKDNQLRDKDQEIQEKDQQIRKRDDQLREKDQQIRERDDQLREKDQQIDQEIMELQLVNMCPSTSQHHKEMVDPSTIPPPESRHTNPSSHIDDDDIQLIKDSTLLGYRSPPANNVTVGKRLDISALPPPDHGEGDEFGSVTQHTNPSDYNNDNDIQLIKDSTQLGYRNPPANNVTEDKRLDISALPPPDHGEGDEFGSVTQHINSSAYNDDDDIQLIKDSTLLGYHNPPKSQVKPIIQPRVDPTGYPCGYRPLPTTLPSDSAVVSPNRDDKFGKTNLKVLKNRLRHRKEAQTVIQTGSAGPHTQTANTKIPYQGVSDNAGKSDSTSLRNKLKKAKEVIKKTATGSVSDNPDDYCNVSEISSKNPVTINNPHAKKPMASPRTHSASSSKRTYQLWQCANCQTINVARHTACEHCKLLRGKMSDRSYLCNFCQLMIFIPVRRADFKGTSCPRCKHIII